MTFSSDAFPSEVFSTRTVPPGLVMRPNTDEVWEVLVGVLIQNTDTFVLKWKVARNAITDMKNPSLVIYVIE